MYKKEAWGENYTAWSENDVASSFNPPVVRPDCSQMSENSGQILSVFVKLLITVKMLY